MLKKYTGKNKKYKNWPFLNDPIFKGVNQPIFEGKYYNWFIKKKYKNKKVLFKQGEKRQKIFFILNSKMNFIELNKLIENK